MILLHLVSVTQLPPLKIITPQQTGKLNVGACKAETQSYRAQ